MIYQELFQFDEDPNSQNISIVRYCNEHPDVHLGHFPPHSHAYYELDYTYDHSALIEFDNRKIKAEAGSLVFYPPLSIHSITDSDRHHHLIIQFTSRLLQNNLSGFTENHVLIPDNILHESGQLRLPELSGSRLPQIISEITEYVPAFVPRAQNHSVQHPIAFSPADRLHLSALVIMLVAELIHNGYLSIENTNPSASPNNSTIPQMQLLVKRLIEHPEEKLSMEDAAAMTNMGYSHFCRTFKSTTGYAYVDFCNIQRVARAKEMLKYTDMSVTEISMQLNFGSISYFNRVFKKFTDMSPLNYRIFSRNSQ